MDGIIIQCFTSASPDSSLSLKGISKVQPGANMATDKFLFLISLRAVSHWKPPPPRHPRPNTSTPTNISVLRESFSCPSALTELVKLSGVTLPSLSCQQRELESMWKLIRNKHIHAPKYKLTDPYPLRHFNVNVHSNKEIDTLAPQVHV